MGVSRENNCFMLFDFLLFSILSHPKSPVNCRLPMNVSRDAMSNGHRNRKILSTTSLLKSRDGISLKETEVKERNLKCFRLMEFSFSSVYRLVFSQRKCYCL